MKLVRVITALSIYLVSAANVWGQLSDSDLDRMRLRSGREGWTFTIGRNAITGLSIEQVCGTKIFVDTTGGARFNSFQNLPDVELPTKFDWRDSSAVTPVKYQFPCGSCWAHATAGVLESAIKIVDGDLVDLSEQWLVSCNTSGFGCDGGGWAYDYFLSRGDPCGDSGAVFESVFPYESADAVCDCPYGGNRYFIDDWGYIGPELGIADTEAMKWAILQYGPIGAAVYVSPEWQAYTGGVFNYCVEGPLNHLVILVGWDDGLGENGVWIMKNSFGTDWGDEGYMLIEYGCSMVGYAATWVEYNGPVRMNAEPSCGPVPHDVQFSASTGFQVESWNWDFGDGFSATQQNPAHVYDDAGVYDVTVTVDTDEGAKSTTREDFIVVHADTIEAEDITCSPGTQIEMVLSANNTMSVRYLRIPVEFPGDFSLAFDSFSTAGCRTESFELQEYLHYDPFWGRRFTLKLVASEQGTTPDLEPGAGPMVKLFFTIPAGTSEGQFSEVILDGYDDYSPQYQSPLAAYRIESEPGRIEIRETCCRLPGDVNHDGRVDGLDFQYLRDYLHRGGPEPGCPDEADVNGDGEITKDDMSCLARYLFSTANPCQLSDCR